MTAMSIEQVPGTALKYYLIAFSADGQERANDPDGLMSQRALTDLANEPVTDVFLISHGWKGDIPAAREQYNAWIGAMAACPDDIARMKERRPGFQPLLIGLHWPSLPFGDEEFGSAAASFAASAATPVEELIDRYAERLADTPAARAALRAIFEAAEQDVAPPTLPAEVRAAYEVLDREAALGSQGAAGAPGADHEAFDPERVYREAQSETVSFGGFSMGSLLSPLQQLSFWKMKDRARKIGESAGFALLGALQRAAPPERKVRFHLMGHSFGCIVVSATLAGPDGNGQMVRPVDSAALVQGALSLWSYCDDIPRAAGHSGYFHRVVKDGRVAGPLITTQSEYDTAVGRWYPLGSGAARQVDFAPGELPKYGGVGTFGIRGLASGIADMQMLPANGAYGFAAGTIYNLESGQYIRNGGGASGAHSDISHPEVAHTVWQTAGSR
jgi:hypothetical protein